MGESNNFSKKKVSGADILAKFENATFDSNGKRILSDVDYIITVLTIDGKENVIIRDVDSDYDAMVLMRLMYYTEVGFDKVIETCNELNLSFDATESQIQDMISSLVKNEKYEKAAKLTNEWNEYVKNYNK